MVARLLSKLTIDMFLPDRVKADSISKRVVTRWSSGELNYARTHVHADVLEMMKKEREFTS